jgi:hypothetical protein
MKTIKTLQDLNREDGITTFTEELGQHPGHVLFEQYISAYKDLDDVEKAQHKLSDSQVYRDYIDAQKYGIQIYNVRTSQGIHPPTDVYSVDNAIFVQK